MSRGGQNKCPGGGGGGGYGVEALCPGGYHDISHQQGCTIILWSSPMFCDIVY